MAKNLKAVRDTFTHFVGDLKELMDSYDVQIDDLNTQRASLQDQIVSLQQEKADAIAAYNKLKNINI